MDCADVQRGHDSGCDVIFGFNTDVKYGDTVYHVQSEVRENVSLLQTQVFVKGRCLGKYATSFAHHAGPDFNEDRLHDLLKQQHKHFVECARAGTIDEEIESGRGVPQAAPPVEAVPQAAPVPATRAFESPALGSDPATDPFAAFSTPPPSPLAKQIFGLDEPTEQEEKEEEKEERISISLGDDPDLAAIADASAAAIVDTERYTPPPAPLPVRVEEVPDEPVERPPDPVLDSFMAELAAAEKEPPPPPLPQFRVDVAGHVIGKGIGLDCLEPIVAPDGTSVLLNVQVSEEGNACNGAQITCRIAMPGGPASYVYSTSNANGIADVKIATQGLQPSTPLLIQAAVHGKSASRKFTLKRA